MNLPGASQSRAPPGSAPLREIHAHGTVRDFLAEQRGSAFTRYRALTFPDASLFQFMLFELATMFLLPAPGALGLLLRRKLLGTFFGSMARNVIIGRNCTFRHPRRIFLGDSVVIDDDCLLDARGCGADGLRIGDSSIVSRGCTIKSKGGGVRIGRRVNIGGASHIVSHCGISIGDDTAIAGACQINGGTFALAEFSKPPSERTPVSAGPIEIGHGVWLATAVVVLDGVRIGDDSIVSAGSVVTQPVPARTVVQGNPAKKIFALR